MRGVRRDRDAVVEELFRREYVSMVRLAVLLVDDRTTAEEVVQDAFARLLGGWRRVRDPASLSGYLRSSVVNGCRSQLRRRAVRRRAPWPDAGAVPSAEHDAVNHSAADEMYALLARLPRRQRECLVLRYFADLSEAEVADTLGISTGSVKTHTHRGLRALDRLVGEEVP